MRVSFIENFKIYFLLGSILAMLSLAACQPSGGGRLASATSTSTPGSPNPNPSPGPSPGPGPSPSPGLSPNETYFVNTIRPLFQQRCGSCHNEPRFVTGTAAPLTILNYSQMRPKLATGGGAVSNNLIRQTAGQLPHSGGNMCPLGVTANDPVCGKLIEWYQKEFPTSAAGLAGQVLYVNYAGFVEGWALNPVAPATKIKVLFYRDNPAGQGGVLMGEAMANLSGLGTYNGNYFNFTIPANFIDNTTKSLYVYMETATAANLIPGMPLAYGAYKRTQAGITHFNNNILPTIQNTCLACHAFNIDSGWANMLSPPPSEGGTPTNNNFIMNASGNNHPINGCPGGINSGLCAQIQAWWNIEF